MDLPSPTSLADLRTDGALLQTDVDATWHSTMGTVTGVEFTGDTARVHRRAGTRDLPATEVARIVDGRWEWSRRYDLDIPELHSPQPASDELIDAARTLHGNVPVLLAPSADGTRVFAVDFRPVPGPVRSALTLGLAGIDPLFDARRALLAFAAARGLGVRTDAGNVSFSDGTTVTFDGDLPVDVSGGMTLDDVRADAHYFAAEHQLLLAGTFPGLQLRLDIGRGRALLSDRLEATALPVATVTGIYGRGRGPTRIFRPPRRRTCAGSAWTTASSTSSVPAFRRSGRSGWGWWMPSSRFSACGPTLSPH